MIVNIVSFTKAGKMLEKRLCAVCPELTFLSKPDSEPLFDWTKDCFFKRLPIIFIGAMGIAVRTISSFVGDKFTDSPILVIDEEGKFVIPVLSGHIGGANELASVIAKKLSAQAVITTATDVHGVFSVDNFARKNGFSIENRDGIKNTAKNLMEGKKLGIWISPEIEVKDDKMPDCLVRLSPKVYCVGIGCKKNKIFEELLKFLKCHLSSEVLSQIFCFASIDLKKNEIGLMTLAQFFHADFKTFSAAELETVCAPEGGFSESEFVKDVTGVGGVCERAAMAAAGEGARLVIRKIAEDGMTLAVAQRIPKIITWEAGVQGAL